MVLLGFVKDEKFETVLLMSDFQGEFCSKKVVYFAK
jgi:hypothetical protein